jgi:hypothetical protein
MFPLGGCATYSYGNVAGGQSGLVLPAVANPASILITEGDLKRPYTSLGDIEVTVNKTTIFNKDPTRADIDAALREKAAALGADAVIFARYGTVGISLISWGSLDGRGRAVAYAR